MSWDKVLEFLGGEHVKDAWTNPNHTCFCLIGALKKACGHSPAKDILSWDDYWDHIAELHHEAFGYYLEGGLKMERNLIAWNDTAPSLAAVQSLVKRMMLRPSEDTVWVICDGLGWAVGVYRDRGKAKAWESFVDSVDPDYCDVHEVKIR